MRLLNALIATSRRRTANAGGNATEILAGGYVGNYTHHRRRVLRTVAAQNHKDCVQLTVKEFFRASSEL